MYQSHNTSPGLFRRLLAVVALGCMVATGTAQTAQPDPQAAKPKSATPGPLADGFPEENVFFYLYNEYVNFAAKPDHVVLTRKKYEELTKSSKPKELAQKWSISELAIRGMLGGGNETRLSIDVQLVVDDEQGARVDLKMQEAGIERATTQDGEPAPLKRAAEGYILEISKKGVYRYSFDLFVSTERTPTENRIQLTLPSSSVKRAELTSGEPLLFARDTGTDEKLTISDDKFTIRPPLRGDDSLKIAWRSGKTDEAPTGPTRRVHGVLQYRLDGSTIETEATLTIDLGATNQTCAFRIPAGERVLSVAPRQEGEPTFPYEMEHLTDYSRLVVDFGSRVNRQLQVRILTERTRPDGDGPLRLGHFEVEQAESQTGYVLLFTKDDLWVQFDPKQGMRRVELALLDPELQLLQPARAYQYTSQPAVLELELQTEPVVTAVAETRVVAGSAQAQIVSKFRFQIRQAETNILHLRVPSEMEIHKIEELSLIKREEARAVEGEPNLKEIPLVFSSSKIGPVDVTLEGSIPLTANQPNLLRLPSPGPGVRWSGEVMVETEGGLTLEIDKQKLQNLRREPLPTEQNPERLIWYFRHDRSNPVLAFQLHELADKVDVTVDSQFRWAESRILVESQLSFRSANRRLNEVVLQVPDQLTAVTVTGGGEFVQAGTVLSSGKQTLQLVNPRQKCDIQVQYEIPLANEGPVYVDIPLVLPGAGEVSSYKGKIWCEPGLRVGVVGPWESEAASPTESQSLEEKPSVVIASDRPPATLGLQLDPNVALAPLVIPRVAIEDVQAGNGRHWGVVRMLISTHRVRDVRLFFPTGCELHKLAIDGETVDEFQAESRSVFRVRLPATDRPCSLEISYIANYPAWRTFGSLRKLDLRVPSIADDVAVQEVRWVIRSKRDLLVLGEGGQDFSRLGWSWMGYLKPAESVDLSNSSDQWLLAGDGNLKWSRELGAFVAVDGTRKWTREVWGNAHSLAIWTTPHSFWILLCSGLVLVAGLSVSRSPVVVQLRVLAAGAALTVLGLLFIPGWTLWVLFGAQWGAYLAAAAIVIRHLAVRRRRVKYMIGRTIRRHEGDTSSLSSLVRRLQPDDRSRAAKLGTTIDA